MKIVVIGLGSMGKRRVRLIKEMYPDYEIIGVDGREERRVEAKSMFEMKCYSTIEDIQEQIECAFVCTSPLSHSSIINFCIKKGWHVFTELNLVSEHYEENIKLAKEKQKVLFLSSTFLYREETKYISSRISQEKKWNYVYHIGQYLPDWHPWEHYNEFFIGDKRTNGCREIMAIELPWLTNAFGSIESIQVMSDKMTELNIGFNDNYMVLIKHADGNKGILIVDVVSPVAVRKMEAYSENAYIAWNGTPDSIVEYNSFNKRIENVVLQEAVEHKEGYSAFIVENAYKNEIKAFFDVVNGHNKPIYGFEEDKIILNIIDSMDELI